MASPTFSSRVQLAKPCSSVAASCIWPRQRLTLLNSSPGAARPRQRRDRQLERLVARGNHDRRGPHAGGRLLLPAGGKLPIGMRLSGRRPDAGEELVRSRSASGSTRAIGPMTLKNQAWPLSGSIAASMRSVGFGGSDAVGGTTCRTASFGTIVRLDLLLRRQPIALRHAAATQQTKNANGHEIAVRRVQRGWREHAIEPTRAKVDRRDGASRRPASISMNYTAPAAGWYRRFSRIAAGPARPMR